MAVILAGGQGSRVGYRQKGLLTFQGRTMVEIIIENLQQQVPRVFINANVQLEVYQTFTTSKTAVFADKSQGFLGPLAGMQAAWQTLSAEWILFVPCDNPHLPSALFETMHDTFKLQPAPLIVAHDGERLQPLYLLMHRSMQSALDSAIAKQHLSVKRWLLDHPHSLADFSHIGGAQAFSNMNSAEQYLK